VLGAISKGMQAARLCYNKILQFLECQLKVPQNGCCCCWKGTDQQSLSQPWIIQLDLLCFLGEHWITVSWIQISCLPPLVAKKDKWHGFLMGRLAFLTPTNSVKALKETQSIDHNQWPGFNVSSSTTGLPMEEELVPSRQLTDATTNTYTHYEL